MATNSTISDKSLKELRARAKARGLKGYSKLTKEQLVRLLERSAPESVGASARTKKKRSRAEPTTTSSKTSKNARSIRPSAPPAIAAKPAPPPATAEKGPAPSSPDVPAFAVNEEWVERTKYALRPNGNAHAEVSADLDEDIDRLPVLDEPVVCLLPQKPGVLHAYWVLPPDAPGERVDYKLRLCRMSGGATDVCEEVVVPAARGSWYFHVPDTNDNAGLLVQLGYYRDGRFVSARGRSVAYLPSVYASTRTDERWWVSEADFMRMYLRAGGFVAPSDRYGWVAAVGSSGGASSSSN